MEIALEFYELIIGLFEKRHELAYPFVLQLLNRMNSLRLF